jgi:hypothetical protein
MTETRADQIAWAKARAMEYVEMGEFEMAVSSLTSDMTKILESRDIGAYAMAGTRLLIGENLSEKAIQAWIESAR